MPSTTDTNSAQPIVDLIVRVSKTGYRDATLDSDKDQEARLRAWAGPAGYVVGRVHYERDVSGKTTNRKALKAAKARVLAGEADALAAAYVSRFSRNTLEGLELVSDILEAGREFIALDLAGMNLRTPAGEQFLTMVLGQARAEWRMRQESFDHFRAKSITAGKAPHERFGYRKGADGVLVPDPVESPWVERVFRKRAAGASYGDIAAWLNTKGIRPHAFSDRRDGKATKRTRGERWTHARVKAMLQSRTYLGEAHSGQYVNPTAHRPLVDAVLFGRVQAMRDLRPRRGKADYELSGIVRCADCGGRMRGSTTVNRGREYRYYQCTCANMRKAHAGRLEAAVRDMFADVSRGLRVYGMQAGGSLDAALEGVERARARVADVAGDMELRDLSRDAYNAAVATAQAAVDEANRTVAVVRQRVTGTTVSDDDLANWSTLPVDTRRRFLAEAFEAVYVAPDRAGWAPLGRGELADVERVTGGFLALA